MGSTTEGKGAPVTSVLGKVPYEAGIYWNRQTGDIVVVEDVGGTGKPPVVYKRRLKKAKGWGWREL